MSESASARQENPAADGQAPRWLWSNQPQEPASPPQEQVAGPSAGGRDAVSGDSIPAGSATERCWLCGARLAVQMMVADGGSGCQDVRWYCRNTRVCTDRWTAQRTRRLDSGEPASVP
jgi:hypothetical protein